mmetsp:Transcript_45283/g.98246  ORF Transcript_45283/g.98246 Transcript_45283/m.98246 type:complete len:420 (-) Transcript_45283:60-1319(-)
MNSSSDSLSSPSTSIFASFCFCSVGGINAGLVAGARAEVTCTRFIMESVLLPSTLWSSLLFSSASHPMIFTSSTPTLVAQEVDIIFTVDPSPSQMVLSNSRSAADRSSTFLRSSLFSTTNNGLPLNKGLMEWNKATCCSRVKPQVSEMSTKKEDRSLDMSQRCDGCHLDGIAVLQGVVQDTRGVDNLPPQVVVVHVPDVQRLGGERVGLDLHIGVGHNIHEAGLPDVGVPSHEEGPRVRVDGGQAPQVLSNLLQVHQAALQLLDSSAHAPQRSTLEHFGLVGGVSKLHQLAIILGYGVHHAAHCVHLAQSELVMVPVVEHIAQVRIERVNIVDHREILQDFCELFVECGLRVLDLAHVKRTNTSDLELGVNLGGRLPLHPRQHDINEIFGIWYGLDFFEFVQRHGGGRAGSRGSYSQRA